MVKLYARQSIACLLCLILVLTMLTSCTAANPEASPGTWQPSSGPSAGANPTDIPSAPASITSVPIETGGVVDISAAPSSDPQSTLGLPVVESVTLDTPLLYDFVNGCLDWHVSIHRDLFESTFYILRNIKAPNVLYTDRYIIQADVIFPPEGSAIEVHVLLDDELVAFNKVVASAPDTHVLQEGDWELYIVAGDLAAAVYDTNIELWSAEDYTVGNPRPFMKDNSGWPTEWLRKEPYRTNILNYFGVDMNDPWWDEWNYQGVYYMEPQEGSRDVGRPKLTCTGVETFLYDFNGTAITVDWNEVRDDCNHMVYCIPGHYNAWEWDSMGDFGG